MAGPNIYRPDFEPDEEPSGFFRRRARIGRDAGAQRLGATLMELPPGKTATPYHVHYANEELLVVVSGTPSLRTPEGWRELEEGEVVSFPVGEEGAHQVSNFSNADVRILMVSEMNGPEVATYPDSGKLWVSENAPGPKVEGLRELFSREDALDYWEGEEPPQRP